MEIDINEIKIKLFWAIEENNVQILNEILTIIKTNNIESHMVEYFPLQMMCDIFSKHELLMIKIHHRKLMTFSPFEHAIDINWYHGARLLHQNDISSHEYLSRTYLLNAFSQDTNFEYQDWLCDNYDPKYITHNPIITTQKIFESQVNDGETTICKYYYSVNNWCSDIISDFRLIIRNPDSIYNPCSIIYMYSLYKFITDKFCKNF